MSDSQKAGFLDGYSVVKAVKHAKGTEPAGKGKESAATRSAKRKQAPVKPGGHIGHTVLPKKNRIRCYECGYEFLLTVRVQSTYCPKCRVSVNLVDYTIDGEWVGDLKTAGTIRIASQAVIKSGHLVAGDIVLNGKIEDGNIKAARRLELGPGSVFCAEKMTAPDLKIAEGAEIAIDEESICRDVEICGTLRANLQASGTVCIRAGALFRGVLQTEHLLVDEGGGLIGNVVVTPPSHAS